MKKAGFLCLGILFLLCCLTGCSRKTPVETAFNEVETSVVEIKDALPKECKTDIVTTKIKAVEQKIQIAEQVCDAKIKDTQIKYERVLWVLGLIIFGFLVKIFIKK